MSRYIWGDSQRFRLREASHVAATGLRPSVQRVLDLIDLGDPAWPGIAAVLCEFDAAGIDLNAETAGMAVKIGRRQWGRREPSVQPTLTSASGSIVYYIRRGCLIKIGTTTQPQVRFRDLMPDEILATEPGGREQEGARHRQFAHLQAGCGREHFRDAAELLEHIRRLRAMYGEADPSWVTTSTGKDHWRLPMASSIDMLTTADAEEQLGIRPNTIRKWRSRGRIEPAGKDDRRRLLFYREHLIRLRDSTRARLADGF